MDTGTGEGPQDTDDGASGGITFASERDVARYRVLARRRQRLQARLVAVEGEMTALVRRATWSVEALLEREG